MMMNGIGVSPGIAIGTARILQKQTSAVSGIPLGGPKDVVIEIEKFNLAVAHSAAQLTTLISNCDGNEGADILETHLELLNDEQLREDVTSKISHELKNANDALIEVINQTAALFKNMDDEYLSARAADVQDIGNRLLANLNLASQVQSTNYNPDTILIAEDLTPSDTISINTSLVTGFATQVGGRTSHTAIVARSKGIPAVVGCGPQLSAICNGDTLIIDGSTGQIIVNPNQYTIDQYIIQRKAWLEQNNMLQGLKNIPATTTDGTFIQLLANIGNAADMDAAHDFGAQGSGLLRTELLFMERNNSPAEDEQFEFYKAAALKAKGKTVVVRTLDIGGDKQLPYFNFPPEQNPFLGYRAIRICLDRTDIFITQLKAILRASIFGKLRIMFPMIASVQEIRAAKTILQQAKTELQAGGIAFDNNIPVGIMIEIPSAAITADLLAREVDFFSIGTNDLCQYMLAVDRMNEQIKDLYDPYNPGVLRLIAHVIEQGYQAGIEVGMCGELAADPLATPLLLGMGLTEFSMSAAAIPAIKNIIINFSLPAAKQVYQRVREMDSSDLIIAYLKEISL